MSGHLVSDAVHSIEDILPLDADGQFLFLAGLGQNVGHVTDGLCAGGGVERHHEARHDL